MNDFIDSIFDSIANMFAGVDVASLYPKLEGYIKITGVEAKTLEGVNAIYKMFAPIAMYMLLIYGLMALLDLYQRDNMTMEQLVKVIFRFGVAIVFISNGGAIIGQIASLGDSLITRLSNSIPLNSITYNVKVDTHNSVTSLAFEAAKGAAAGGTFGGATGAAAGATIAGIRALLSGGTVQQTCNGFGEAIRYTIAAQHLGFLKGLILILLALPIGLIAKIMELILTVQCITRSVELMIRLGFSSLACSELYGDLHRSNAIRYFKKIFALSLQGVGIYFAFFVISTMQQPHLTKFLSALGGAGELSFFSAEAFGELCTAMLYEFVAIGVIATIKQVINDALGC